MNQSVQQVKPVQQSMLRQQNAIYTDNKCIDGKCSYW